MSVQVQEATIESINTETVEETTSTETQNEDSQTEETTNDSNENSEDEGSEQSEEDKLKTARALEIYEILNDPDKSEAFLNILKANLKKDTKDEGKDGQQAAELSLAEELKKELDEADHFMLEPMLKMFNKLFSRAIQSRDQEILKIRQEIVAENVIATYDSFAKANNITPELEKEMEKISKEYPPTKTGPVDKYLNNLLVLAKANLNITGSSKSNEDKLRNNKANQNRQKGTETKPVQGKRPANASVADAVAAAARGEIWD